MSVDNSTEQIASLEEISPSENNIHEWRPAFMPKPTWCFICKGFIYGVTKGSQKAYKCEKCGINVHKRCCDKEHVCSGELQDIPSPRGLKSGTSGDYSNPPNHDGHEWQSIFLPKPTWCGNCSSFIYGITSEQQNAFKCTKCGICSHRKCCLIPGDFPCTGDENSNPTSKSTHDRNNEIAPDSDFDRRITAVVKGARKLKITQTIGDQDPYVRLWTSSDRGNKKRTKTYVDGHSMAVWNETIELRTVSTVVSFICVEVKNENSLQKDVVIGRMKVPCDEVTDVPQEGWYVLKDQDGEFAGEVHLSLVYNTDHDTGEDLEPSVSPSTPSLKAAVASMSRADARIPKMAHVATAAIGVQSARDIFNLNGKLPNAKDASVGLPTPPQSSNLQCGSSVESGPPLPPGWEQRYTKSGKAYYVNHIDNVTSWNRPA